MGNRRDHGLAPHCAAAGGAIGVFGCTRTVAETGVRLCDQHRRLSATDLLRAGGGPRDHHSRYCYRLAGETGEKGQPKRGLTSKDVAPFLGVTREVDGLNLRNVPGSFHR